MEIEKDVLKNANYIIQYFDEKGKKITPLMLQKLLYFLEAIYMVINKCDGFFEEEFSAWNFGPVNDEVYKAYKQYANMPIILKQKETIPELNRKYIEQLYELFKDFSAFQLVGLSHTEGSPWSELNKKYDNDIPRNEIIDKVKTKEWFGKLVTIDDENSK